MVGDAGAGADGFFSKNFARRSRRGEEARSFSANPKGHLSSITQFKFNHQELEGATRRFCTTPSRFSSHLRALRANFFPLGFQTQFSLVGERERRSARKRWSCFRLVAVYGLRPVGPPTLIPGPPLKIRILHWRAKVPKFRQAALFKGGASSLP